MYIGIFGFELLFALDHVRTCTPCNKVDWPNPLDAILRLSRPVSHLNGTRPLHGLLTALPRARSFISLAKTTANSERYWNVIYMHYIYHFISFCCCFSRHCICILKLSACCCRNRLARWRSRSTGSSCWGQSPESTPCCRRARVVRIGTWKSSSNGRTNDSIYRIRRPCKLKYIKLRVVFLFHILC